MYKYIVNNVNSIKMYQYFQYFVNLLTLSLERYIGTALHQGSPKSKLRLAGRAGPVNSYYSTLQRIMTNVFKHNMYITNRYCPHVVIYRWLKSQI